jgi:hypothetical protein
MTITSFPFPYKTASLAVSRAHLSTLFIKYLVHFSRGHGVSSCPTPGFLDLGLQYFGENRRIGVMTRVVTCRERLHVAGMGVTLGSHYESIYYSWLQTMGQVPSRSLVFHPDFTVSPAEVLENPDAQNLIPDKLSQNLFKKYSH